MILHSLKLQDFRGTRSETLTFAERGVTIVSGPNEVGKSSFLIALDMLLSDPDSSTKSAIKAVQPIGRDVGPEASMTFSSGPYRASLTKRWLKSPSTMLEIHQPFKLTLTGRQAHDKVREILNETLDETLWKALRYQQGALHLGYAPAQSETLGAALDSTVGELSTKDNTSTSELITLVRAERSNYFTETGRPTRARTELEQQLHKLEEQISETEAALAHCEGQSEELQRLRASIAPREHELDQHRGKLERHDATWLEFNALKNQLHIADLELTVARSNYQSARLKETDRTRLQERLLAATQEVKDLENSCEKLERRVTVEREALTQATVEAERQRAELAPLLQRRTNIEDQRNDLYRRQEATQLRNLIERVDELQSLQRESEQFLAECTVTPEIVEELEELERHTASTRAKLEVELPRVTVHAHRPFQLGFNDQTHDIDTDEIFSPSATDPLVMTLGDLATVEISGGSNLGELQSAYDRALMGLQSFCAANSIPAEASGLFARTAVRQRENHLERRDQITTQLNQIFTSSGYSTLSSMQEQLHALEIRTPQHVIESDDEISYRRAFDELGDQLTELNEKYSQAERDLGELERRVTEAQATHQTHLSQLKVSEELREIARATTQNLQNELDRANQLEPDSQIANNVLLTTADLEQSQRRCDNLREQLRDPRFDLLDDIRENEVLRINELEEERDSVDRKIERLTGELSALGESGLYSTLEQLRHEREILAVRITITHRQARAVDKLYRTLTYYQYSDRQRLIEPLTQTISALGSALYGSPFEVALDHATLNVTTRTLHGTTLALDQISVGAQEQIALLYMLAVAQIIGRSPTSLDHVTGAPIILDDALGNSDRGRLDQLGILFRMVAANSQIIIFTCYPERFSSVGGARRIELPSSSDSPN
ncbi:MAG: AAA family ATPase [Acidimicrobiales bacterium]